MNTALDHLVVIASSLEEGVVWCERTLGVTPGPGGQRLMDGVLPTLIEWGDVHPADAMPASGLRLRQMRLQHPDAAALQAWADAVGLKGAEWHVGPAALQATLSTPKGEVRLGSPE